MTPLGVAVAVALAAANGANDQMKGVATLIGTGSMSFGAARRWASITTLIGAMAAMFLGARLAASFSGGGLVPAAVLHLPGFLIAVGAGAALTVAIAAKVGLPISTTHALLGGLLGAGQVAAPGQLAYGVLTARFLVPLLASPLLAFTIAATLQFVLRWIGSAARIESASCVCVRESEPILVPVAGGSQFRAIGGAMALPVVETCTAAEGRAGGVTARQVASFAHQISAGIVSGARGLNDTPKIAALMTVVSAVTLGPEAFAIAAVAMVLGGWWGSRRVSETMSGRIATLNEGQGLTANAVTAILVLAASAFALPVSMTHVAVGALVGGGSSDHNADRRALRQIGLAWLGTLPLAALLAGLFYYLQARFLP